MKYILVVFFLILPLLSQAQDAAESGVAAWNFNFGIGVEQYRHDYIEQARIVGEDRIVIIEKEYQTKPSAWLTLSWNFWDIGEGIPKQIAGEKSIDIHKVKFGLFAGTKIIGENSTAFESFALGPQITFQAEGRDISIGFGWVTHQLKTLGNGITEGEALPVQFDDISYKEKTENSYMLMFSIAI